MQGLRFGGDRGAKAELKEATVQRTLSCWRVLEESFGVGPFFLGAQMSILDVYAAMLSRWRPGRERIRDVAPRVIRAVERAEAHPVVGPVFARNFSE